MRPLLVLLVAAAALLTGCGERPEPLDAELSPFPATARGAGGEAIRVEERPERVAALSAGAAEIVAAVGARERLVAGPAELADAEVVRPSGFVDLPALAAAEPDLIVAAPQQDPQTLEVAARRTLAPLYVAPDGSVRDVVRSILEVGLLVGEPVRAREVARALREQVAATERRIADLRPVRTFVDTGFLVTVSDDSLLADIVRRGGGTPVATGAAAPVRPCRLVRLRTEVVLRTVDEASRRQRRPSFGGCDGRRPRIVELPAELVARPGPRLGDAVERVARALHPDALR